MFGRPADDATQLFQAVDAGRPDAAAPRRRPRPRPRPEVSRLPADDNVYVSRHAADQPPL